MSNALSTQVKSLAKTLSLGGNEQELIATLKATAFRGQQINDSQMTALLIVANEHKLNPWTNEIYAFPQNGGIQPIIGIDGWLKLANNNKEFDGLEYDYKFNEAGELLAITCRVYRKDRSRPMEATELMVENRRNTTPWKQYPSRMLKHRATAQAIRSAFGLSGIMLDDEAQAMNDSQVNAPEVDEAVRIELVKRAEEEAKKGVEALQSFWMNGLSAEERLLIGKEELERLKGLSQQVVEAEYKEVQDEQSITA